MIEQNLSIEDKSKLRKTIKNKATFFLILFITIFVLILIAVLIASVFFGNKPTDGFLIRAVHIIGYLVLAFILSMNQELIMLYELFRNRKLIIETNNYSLINTKHGSIIKTEEPKKLKLNTYFDLIPIIKQDEKITIEVTKWSNTVLSIFQNRVNMIEYLEGEVKENTVANNG